MRESAVSHSKLPPLAAGMMRWGRWTAATRLIIVLCASFSKLDVPMKFEMTISSLGEGDSMSDLIILLKAPWMPSSMQSFTTL